MTLTIEDVVTHYVLSSHPRNRAIIDIKDKKSGELRFIKIRHRLSKFYAVSLVDPVTFEVWAETQVKSATARIKPIILHLDNKQDTTVELKDTSRIGFEWTFAWEGEKYRWVRESRMSNSLECRAIRKTGDICVAQYLPRMLKDEYFGIFSLLGYNMLRCNLTKSRELELIILMSLMTVLDKSNDASWKRDPISKGVQDDIRNGGGSGSHTSSSNSSFVSPPSASTAAMDHYEDPIPKKSQQKKHKVELLNDQKLQLMLEKDVRRSQKQIQLDQKNHKPSLSAGNSPNQTPKTSPLPTPSTSTNMVSNILSPRLSRQKSAAQLSDASSLSLTSPTVSTSNHSGTNSGAGRLSRLFNTLSQVKQTNDMVIIAPDTDAPADGFDAFYAAPPLSHAITNESHTKQQQKQQIARDQKLKLQRQKQRQQQQQQQQQQQLLLLQQQQQQQAQMDQDYYEQHHHMSLPTGQLSRFTSDFGNLAINKTSYENPPSLRNIRWNPEPLTPIDTTSSSSTTNKYMSSSSRVPQQQQQQQQQHYPPPHRSNSNGRRPRMADPQRRLSATEYPLYYNPPQHPPHYTNTNYSNRYSTSEYYTHQYHQQQQQQPVYDYYQ